MDHQIKIKHKNPNENFCEYVTEDVLSHISGIESKRIFSGRGIYLDGIIIGLVFDGTLYLKVDKERMEKYIKEGCEPISYERKDGKKSKTVIMSYISVPIETLEDKEAIKERVWESYDISKSLKNKKTNA